MKTPATRRRPTNGGYARGQETRARIIAVALRLFGDRGFDGVSTREIAEEAGVNPPALQYYFDSKEGLYCACAEYVADRVLGATEAMLARAERLLAEKAPATALVEAYCAVSESIVELMFGPEGAVWSAFLGAEQAGFGPGKAYPIFRERFLERADHALSSIVSRLSGDDTPSTEARLRVAAINGQYMVFLNKRPFALAMMKTNGLTPEHARLVKTIVIDHTRTLLSRLSSDEGPHAAGSATGGPER
ncbi:MAG: transcriptional regulator, TetR family [Caulobacteraceae bacterium]|jgi:AcrR family transcriptional regulator|nr:transcriptional regulator, TetR family [Caulobacteraceae bacterium]